MTARLQNEVLLIGAGSGPDPGRALEHRCRRLASLIDHASDAIVCCDESLVVEDWNRGAHRMFGWPAARARGRPLGELIGAPVEAWLPALREHGAHDAEDVYARRDGTRVAVSASVMWLPGGPPRIAAIMRDVSEVRRLQAEVAGAQRLEALGRLAGGIAHDIGNVLAGVLSHAESARVMLPADHPAQRALEAIRFAAVHGARLPRRLLDFGRETPAEVASVDVHRVVERTVAFLGQVMGPSRRLEAELAPRAAWALFPAGQLESALTNLVMNARDAMPLGGLIRVRTRVSPGEVLLEVEDEGEGMDAQTRRRAPEPFFTTKAAHRGSGLGLSTVQGLVESAGGRLELESAPGRGTTARLCLRAAEAVPLSTEDIPCLRPAEACTTDPSGGGP